MGRKLLIAIGMAAFLTCMFIHGAGAYVYYNPDGPDQLLHPGYQWTVKADTASDHHLCLRWATAHPRSWTHTSCSRTAAAPDTWNCTIPDEFTNTRVYYQFYKSAGDEPCDPTGNTWDWTPQHVFVTATIARLNHPTFQDPLLQAGLIGLLWVLGGVIFMLWRYYHY